MVADILFVRKGNSGWHKKIAADVATLPIACCGIAWKFGRGLP